MSVWPSVTKDQQLEKYVVRYLDGVTVGMAYEVVAPNPLDVCDADDRQAILNTADRLRDEPREQLGGFR